MRGLQTLKCDLRYILMPGLPAWPRVVLIWQGLHSAGEVVGS